MLNENTMFMREILKLRLNKRTISIINIVEIYFENNSRNIFFIR